MPEIISEITKYGRIIEMGGNRHITLSDCRSMWFVMAGGIDIFSFLIDNEGNIHGKQYLFTLDAGALIAGYDGTSAGGDIGLMAYGKAGSALVEVKREKVISYLSDDTYRAQLLSAIDGWLRQLLHHCHKELLPLMVNIIEPGKEYSFSQSGCFRTDKEIVWIKSFEGNLSFAGIKDKLHIPDGVMFPVSEKSFIAFEDTCLLSTFDTKACLMSDPDCTYLDGFHALMLISIKQSISNETEYEKQRLKRKVERDASLMDSSLTGFSNILNKKKAVSITTEPENSLLSASRLVGGDLDIKINAPGTTAKEARLKDPLSLIARASGIRTRRIALKGRWWEQDNGPMLGFFEGNNQPIALLFKKHYTLHDTVKGDKQLVSEQVASTISPFAYSFYRPFPEKAMGLYSILKFSSFKNLLDFAVVLLMGIAGGLLGLIIPLCTSLVFDSIIPMAETSQLLQIGLAMVVGAIANAMFQLTGSIAMLRIEGKVDASLQSAVWDRLLSLPVSFFRQYTVGDLANRAMGIDGIRQLITGSVTSAIISAAFSIFSFFLLFYYNLWLALTALAIVVTIIIITSSLSYIVVYYQRRIYELSGRIFGLLYQIIGGIEKFRVSGAEMRGFAQWAKEFKDQKTYNFNSGIAKNIIIALNAIYPVVAYMIIYGVFYHKDMFKLLSTGDFLAFTSAFSQFLAAGLQMSAVSINIIAIIPIYKRAKPIFLSIPEVTEGKRDPGELTGNIEIKNVFFRYHESGQYILRDLSLQINSGEFIAIAGASGSGKSTLLRLLLGFETQQRGSVFYDNHNIQTLDVHSLRRQIGVVLQNGQLMSGNIFNNIVGANNLTLDDAWEAARMSGLEEDIKAMPMGMHTVIAPGASTISGGQKQRILIARAMVTKPRIFFFDEATSALDNLTQTIVSRSLENFYATRLVIAHRLSTIIKADKIVVIDKGSVAETGTYEELMKKNGLFAQLAKRQLA
ncbi:MAG: NHLP bacteriocin export ABC transporter permease/ATPase subunit [Nitrospirae bacterium YQR-1]